MVTMPIVFSITYVALANNGNYFCNYFLLSHGITFVKTIALKYCIEM